MEKYTKLRGTDRFQAADFLIGRYAAKVPAGTTLQEVLHPLYFENHFDRMRAGMEIAVLSDDFSLDVRLRVLTLTKTSAKFRVLDIYAGEQAEAPHVEDNEVKVTWGGPNHKHRVMHGKEIVKFGFATSEEAEEFKTEYLAKINA